MGIPVLVMGFSGSGKSTSMRNFGKDELALVNVNSKPLPFRTRFTSTINSDNYTNIMQFISKSDKKVIVIDDAQYLMLNEYMRRSKENGYQKYTDIAQNFWKLIRLAETLSPDTIVYFLQHIETGEDGRLKVKTVGKLLDNQVNVEGMFTIILRTVVQDRNYWFATQSDGSDTCKTPMGLFESMYIPNDLKAVDDAVRGYYSFEEKEKCENCGSNIISANGKTIEQIIAGSTEKYGKKLCWDCVMKEYNAQKAQQNK